MSSQDGYANYNMGNIAPLKSRKARAAPSQDPDHQMSGVPVGMVESSSSASYSRPQPSRNPSRRAVVDHEYGLQPPSSQLSSRLARAIQQRPTSQLSFASVSDDLEEDSFRREQMAQDSYGYEDRPVVSPEPAPKSMKNVLAALNDAGKRHQRTQQQAQMLAKERARRTGVSEQGESARMKRLQQQLPATPAFRAIERVLGQISQDWPMLLPTDDPEDTPFGSAPESDFNPVPLALALLQPTSMDQQSGSRLEQFLQCKEELGEALKSHIQLHYRAFDASVSAYNGVVANLKAAQKQVHGLKGGIGNVTKVLGSKREELAGMVQRRDELSEMARILDTMFVELVSMARVPHELTRTHSDQLKDVPDKLETLLSEKRFLSAVILLSKSLKTINKSELLDISALADLRAYLHSQEGAVYDILVEELHNHLYLKSFYCEGRWKPYSLGQTDCELNL